MFAEDVENEVIDLMALENEFRAYVLDQTTEIGYHELLAGFVVERGITCSLKDFRDTLRRMENHGEIVIDRTPAYTKKTGVPTRFMEPKGKQQLMIRKA